MTVVAFWDVDGTLIENASGDENLYEETFIRAFPTVPCPANIERHGRTDVGIITEYLTASGNYQEQLVEQMEEILNEVSFYAFTFREGKYILPGVLEVLELCAAHGVVNTILTGNSRLRAELKLASAKIPLTLFNWDVSKFGDREVERYKLGESVAAKKELYGWERITIVGDTPADIEVAKMFNFQSCAVGTGAFSVETLSKVGAGLAIESFEGAAEKVKNYITNG